MSTPALVSIPKKLNLREAVGVAHEAAARVVGSADVSPATRARIEQVLANALWWEITAGDLRRIAEAHS